MIFMGAGTQLLLAKQALEFIEETLALGLIVGLFECSEVAQRLLLLGR